MPYTPQGAFSCPFGTIHLVSPNPIKASGGQSRAPPVAGGARRKPSEQGSARKAPRADAARPLRTALRPPNPRGFFDKLRRMSHGDMRLCSSKRASQNTSTNISAPGWRRCTGSDHLPGRIYRDGRIMAGRIPWNNRCRLHPPIAALNGNTAALPDGRYAPGYGRSPARSTGPRCSPPCEGGRAPG